MAPAARPKVTPPRPRNRGGHALLLWSGILGVCLAALILTYMRYVEPPPPRAIVIASGSKTGAYYQFARRYADELRKEGLALDVRETAGSVENLRLLADDRSGVAVAIVQSGVAGPDDCERLLALGSLYREPLWVFYRGDRPLDRLSQLAGKRIGVGPPGSGTHAVAMQLLAANGLAESSAADSRSRATLANDPVTDAARAIRDGRLDAAFFVAAPEADYIRDLLHDQTVHLLSFAQQEAYHRRFRFLSAVTFPTGLVDLGQNVPTHDVALLAPTAELVIRRDLHPALVPLLLTVATRVHARGDELSRPGEFPSAAYTDIPVSEDAKHFYKSGPPVLQRLLNFWAASLVDRAKVMLIPVIVLLMPLLRTAPPLVRWRMRRKVYLWYSALREIDEKVATGLTGPQIDDELDHVRAIENQVTFVEVPLSYMKEFYHLRLHLTMLRETLTRLKREQGLVPSHDSSSTASAP